MENTRKNIYDPITHFDASKYIEKALKEGYVEINPRCFIEKIGYCSDYDNTEILLILCLEGRDLCIRFKGYRGDICDNIPDIVNGYFNIWRAE